MNPRLILARRRALHPGYVRAVESKIDCPPEIYAYPAQARRQTPNPWKPARVPSVPAVSAPSLRWLPVAYVVICLGLWVVGANVPGV